MLPIAWFSILVKRLHKSMAASRGGKTTFYGVGTAQCGRRGTDFGVGHLGPSLIGGIMLGNGYSSLSPICFSSKMKIYLTGL